MTNLHARIRAAWPLLAATAGLTITLAAVPAAAWAAGPGSVGVGIQSGDVCLSAAAQPGRSYQPGNVSVTNTGSTSEKISLETGPMPSWQVGTIVTVNGAQRTVWQTMPHPESEFTRHALPVPPAWVTFGYPARLWVISQHSVTIAPGQDASIPVTLNVPGNARHGQYETALIAGTTGTPAPGSGARAALGAAASTFLKFSVDATPPDCNPSPAPQPWWASHPGPGAPPPAGWSFIADRDVNGTALLSGVWTYIPPRGTIPPGAPGGTPPGWKPDAQMQVWTYDGGSSFVMNHVLGWQYLPDIGPLGTTVYEPPGGKLPPWALRLAAGESYTIPGYQGPVTAASPSGAQQGQGQQPASYTAPAGSPASPGTIYALAAGLAVILLIWLARRRRR